MGIYSFICAGMSTYAKRNLYKTHACRGGLIEKGTAVQPSVRQIASVDAVAPHYPDQSQTGRSCCSAFSAR